MSVPEFIGDGRDGGVRGVAVGVVTNNEDPEGLARVKLSFPWRDAADESYWARIATPMAGDGRGTYFLPEVGDEVLVAFEDGDIAHPYVVGALWNGVDAPPADNADGSNDLRLVRSRGGHELVFDDADGGGIEIVTNAGHRIVLDDTGGGETLRIEDASGENHLEFDAAGGSVTLTAATSVSVSAPELTLSGDGNVTIESSGMLTLKGAVIQLN
jgi:uncharacterized protein involved in type VI secretion and phage assembly